MTSSTASNLVMAQSRRPMYYVVPNNPAGSATRKTLRGVLYNEFLAWIERSPFRRLAKITLATSTLAVLSLLAWSPRLFLSLLLFLMDSVSYKVPLVLAPFLMLMNARRIWRLLKRTRIKMRTGNQHTLHGVPIPELATFLIESGSFKRVAAMKKFGLTQPAYVKIAEVLDERQLMIRGDNNARVLRTVSREQLVRQLTTNDLMWDEVNNEWTDKHDSYGRWLRAEGFKSRKLKEETERGERKLEKIKEQIQEAKTQLTGPATLAEVLALSPQ